MEQFRGGLVFKAHSLLYPSTLGTRVIKMKTKYLAVANAASGSLIHSSERLRISALEAPTPDNLGIRSPYPGGFRHQKPLPRRISAYEAPTPEDFGIRSPASEDFGIRSPIPEDVGIRSPYPGRFWH